LGEIAPCFKPSLKSCQTGREILKFSELKASTKKQTNSMASVCKRTIPSEHCLSPKLVPTLADRGCHVIRVTDPYGRIIEFLGRSRHFFFQVASQLYSRGWVDPVPDRLLLRKSGRAGNRTWTSGPVARNSGH
jgi:hypothetical protein